MSVAQLPTSLSAQYSCVLREIQMRKQTYPRWVAAGKMRKAIADQEIATMEAVRETLARLGRIAQAEQKSLAAIERMLELLESLEGDLEVSLREQALDAIVNMAELREQLDRDVIAAQQEGAP
jgi:hypothetical protein